MPPDDQPPPATSTTGPPSWMAPVTPVVPDHELIRRIGGGSYGDVWLARTAVGTWRAVKVVFRDRFLDARPYDREFRGIQKFEPLSRSNEGFIDILQIGRNEEIGYFYYVMELADDANAELGTRSAESTLTHPAGTLSHPMGEGRGEGAAAPVGSIPHSALRDPQSYVPLTLSKELLQRGRLPVRECLELGLTLNLGLAHLHRAGLIHRDIKPSNIIFVGGVPKLADIGLVVETSEAHSYVGTEGFIPPEGPTSPQADLYSLGKVLYEAGMGKDRKDFPEPFTQIAEVADSEQLLEFNAILLKACAASVTERYQSAEQMNADLALLQGGGSVRRQRTLTRRLRFVQRAAVGGVALVALVAGGWLWQARQTRIVRNLAAEKATLANENQARVIQLNVASGIRQMDAGNLGDAMLWFADALKYPANDPARDEMHRFRLTNLLLNHPLPVAHIAIRNDGEEPKKATGVFEVSENGQRMIVQSANGFEIWDLTLPPRRLAVLPYYSTNRHYYSINADGGHILLDAFPHRPQLWHVDGAGRTNMVIVDVGGKTGSIDFATDPRWCIASTTSNYVALISTSSGQVEKWVEWPDINSVWTARPSLGAMWMAVHFTNGLVRMIERTTGRMAGEFMLPPEWSKPRAIANGRRILAQSPNIQDFSNAALRARFRLQLFDVESGLPVGEPMSHEKVILVNDYDRNSRMMATGSVDETARVWSLETGDPISPPLRHSSRVVAVAISRDGSRVATGDGSGMVRVWDIQTGRQLTPPLPHGKSWAHGLRFVRGDSLLASMDNDGLVRFWDLARPELNTVKLESDRSFKRQSLAVSPDGELLAVGRVGQLLVWDTRNWRSAHSLSLPSNESAEYLEFTKDGRHLAYREGGNKVRMIDVQTGRLIGKPFSHGTNRIRLALSPNGERLATVGMDGLIRIWDWREGKEVGQPLVQTPGEGRIHWLASGSRILTSSSIKEGRVERGEGRMWDLASATQVGETFSFKPTPVAPFGRDFAIGSGGLRWAFAGMDGAVHVHSLTGPAISPIPFNQSWQSVSDIEFSPDGQRLAVAYPAAAVVIYDAASGHQTTAAMTHEGDANALRFADSGRRLVAWSDREVRLWDPVTGEPLTPGIKSSQPISGGAVDPKGRFLVFVNAGREVVVQQFAASALDSQVIAGLTRFVTGKRIGPEGTSDFIGRDEWLELGEELHAQCPELFRLSKPALELWHERQINESGSLFSIERSLYHLDRLMELRPHDSTLRDRQTKLLARRPLDRAVDAPQECIDLSTHFTDSLATLGDGELADLPRGLHQLTGTVFDLRGAIQLHQPYWVGSAEPAGGVRVSHIVVGRRCRKLQFLQACQQEKGLENLEAARFIIHYADGSHLVHSMIFGRHLGSWRQNGALTNEVTDAVVAWEGEDPQSSSPDAKIRLNKATWENPNPNVEITHLTYQVGVLRVRPFVVAITAE